MKINKLFLAIAMLLLASTLMTEQIVAQNIVANPDRPPMFMGGPDAMNAFIGRTLQYPEEAFRLGVQGLVVYTFVVETDGSITNIRPVRLAQHPSLDAEAVRIIQAMPAWLPAEHRGQIVRAEATVPLYFSINPNAPRNLPIQQQFNYARTDLSIMENYAVFTLVDRMPQFSTAGNITLDAFIARNICYPREPLADGIEGTVLASFIVAPDGSISNIEIVNGIEGLNEEAIRVLGSMPNWQIGGSRNGVPVHVRMLQAVHFVIDEAPIPTGF